MRATPNPEIPLGPTLSAVLSLGPVHVQEILQFLHRQGTFPNASNEDVRDIYGEVGQTVIRATNLLKEAGLIETDSPRVWRVTRAGRRLAQKQQDVTRADLRRRPKYRKYLKSLEANARRLDWQELRFEYYAAGRLLALEGSFHAAPTTLAYALEYSLKAALTEKGFVRKGHDLPKLYRECLDCGLLSDTEISDDFLGYAHDHFRRRYPRGKRDVLDEKQIVTFGGNTIAVYDDAMIQLDRGLDKLYGAGTWSLGSRALTGHSCSLARAFFHNNVFGVDRLDEYLDSVGHQRVSYPDPEHFERLDLLFSCDSERLGYPSVTYDKARERLGQNLAATFSYPLSPLTSYC